MNPGNADIVWDIGAQVGGFTKWALELGARNITSVELDQATCDVLLHNLVTFKQKMSDANLKVLNAVMQHAAGSSKLVTSRAAASARKRYSTDERLVDTCRGRVADAAGTRDVPTDFVPSVSFRALQS